MFLRGGFGPWLDQPLLRYRVFPCWIMLHHMSISHLEGHHRFTDGQTQSSVMVLGCCEVLIC